MAVNISSTKKQKSILITGCSSGIGKDSALYLASQGVTVFASVRKESDALSLCEEAAENLIPLCPLDLTDLDQIEKVAARVKEELRARNLHGLNGILHNAGAGGPAPLEMLELAGLQTQLQARVVGSLALTQACLPLLRQANGRVLWILTPGLFPTIFVSSIHVCDFAVNCMARTLALELKPWHIPSILIRCGGIQTPAGARTASDVDILLQKNTLNKADLYRSQLKKWAAEMETFDRHRTPAQKVAEVVYRAFTSSHPHSRYSVGYLSGLSAFVESLPPALTDVLMGLRS